MIRKPSGSIWRRWSASKVQKQIAEKRAEKKEEEALKEKRLVKAESEEKLMEQIKAGRSQPAKAREEGKGARLDLTI